MVSFVTHVVTFSARTTGDKVLVYVPAVNSSVRVSSTIVLSCACLYLPVCPLVPSTATVSVYPPPPPPHRVLSTSANTVLCCTLTSDATHASPSHSAHPSCTPHNPPHSTQSHLHHVPSHERQASQILHKPHPPHTSISCHGLVPFHQVPSSPKGEPGVVVAERVVVVVVEMVIVKTVMMVRTKWSFTTRVKKFT